LKREIVRFSSRFIGLFLIAVLLISTTGLGLNLSTPVMAAKNPVTCTDTPIKGVAASASDANFPALAVLDQNPETLWSTFGKGSWIQLDLGKAKTLCNIDISWYKGDQRNNNFAISISNDGMSYKTLFNSKSTGTTATFERYDLQNVVARYIKITVNGNTQNNYASIIDINVSTNEGNSSDQAKKSVAALSEDCVKTKVSEVTASGNKKPYVPNNAIDNNAKTRWVNEKKDSWIKLDLGKTQTICEVGVQWNKGDSRVYSFTVSVSKDNKKFTDVAKLKSSGKTNDLETYSLKEVGARYVRITVTKNTENNFASIVEIAIGSKNSPNPSPPPPSSDKCESNLPVSGVKASASQSGNPASGATDNNPNSRWSNQGFGSWIQLDLRSVKKICSADISWYRGNERQYTFDISSSQDGNIFTKIFSGINTVTNAPEKYTFSETQARYLKITVTGNTQNDWASISEVDIFGSLDSPTPTPTPTPAPTPTPTPGPISDDVQEIYPTATGGETWFFNPNNPVDGQFDSNGAEISKNSDGSWHLKPGTTRMNVYTKSAGLLSDKQRSNLATYDYSALAQKGYWYQPTDWKNVEATGYFKVSSSSSGDGISFVTRSVRHSNAIENGCGGSAYHNNIRFDGTFQYKKEMWHVNYDILSPTKNGIGSIMNKWVGFKGVVYNLPDGTVKLESYVDKDNNNHWQKVEELVDSGHWGNDMTHCNANTPGAAITWASPMFDYKSTGVTYDFKKLSLREITPPQ
jgi:hypothetical protein